MVTQYSYRTCELFFFLRKATLAQPAPMSRHIPFPGDSGGGERAKCITLLVSFFMPSLKRAQCFLSGLKWVKTTVLRSFPAEGNGVKRQRRHQAAGGSDCLVYDRRVQVLPSGVKREVSLCEEQLGSRPHDLLASYLLGGHTQNTHFKFSVTIGIFS